jgi:transposase InsO family protein
MRQAGLDGIPARRRRSLTRRRRGIAPHPDLVSRHFNPAKNLLWMADISYIQTNEGRLYLATILDSFARRIVGWSMASHLRTELAVDAFEMATARRRPRPGLVHAEARADPPAPVADPRCGPHRRLRLHRDLLQPTPASLHERHVESCTLRRGRERRGTRGDQSCLDSACPRNRVKTTTERLHLGPRRHRRALKSRKYRRGHPARLATLNPSCDRP